MLWSKPKRQAPPRVPTDAIFGMHVVDRNPGLATTVMQYTWRFDDILDIGKLRAALHRLVHIGHWNKLGARIHRRSDGHLEWHLPVAYGEDRPAFTWTNETYSISIADDPGGCQIPNLAGSSSSSDEARVVGDHPSSFSTAVLPGYVPRKLDDWLYSDLPALYVHTSLFEDATLLTLSVPHELMDGAATGAFMRAWSAVLRGREDQVLPTLDFRPDTVGEALLNKVAKEKSVSYTLIMSGFQMLLLLINLLWETLTRPVTGGLIRIPEKHIKGLRRHALESLPLLPNGEKPFISESDILMAWLGRAVARGMNPRLTKPFVFVNMMDMRASLGEDIPRDTVLVGNCISPSTARVSGLKLLREPLSETAGVIRNNLVTHRSREQLCAIHQLWWENWKQKKPPVMRNPPMGLPDMTIIYWSNWLSAKFGEVDFSSAVIRAGKPQIKRANPSGFASWMGSYSDNRILGWERNNGHLTHRDAAGNWWLQWHARRDVWPSIKKDLAMLNQGVYN